MGMADELSESIEAFGDEVEAMLAAMIAARLVPYELRIADLARRVAKLETELAALQGKAPGSVARTSALPPNFGP